MSFEYLLPLFCNWKSLYNLIFNNGSVSQPTWILPKLLPTSQFWTPWTQGQRHLPEEGTSSWDLNNVRDKLAGWTGELSRPRNDMCKNPITQESQPVKSLRAGRGGDWKVGRQRCNRSPRGSKQHLVPQLYRTGSKSINQSLKKWTYSERGCSPHYWLSTQCHAPLFLINRILVLPGTHPSRMVPQPRGYIPMDWN